VSRAGLQHLTLDTGHTRVSHRHEVAGEVLDRLYPLTQAGRWPLDPAPGGPAEIAVTVDGSAALVTVYRGGAPLVTFAVAADDQAASQLWPLITVPAGPPGGYPAARPTATPWLAARLETGVTVHPADLAWLGDFERCWAWAWLDGKG
jgi:hypothetical protein